MAQEMTRLAAAALLETFPNTTMTVAYTAGPAWVSPAAARRAVAFDAHADQPITLADMPRRRARRAARAARVPLIRDDRDQVSAPVRLARAHQQLRAADPASGVTVAAVARQGWPARPSRGLPAPVRPAAQPTLRS